MTTYDFSENGVYIQFHVIFGEEATTEFGDIIVDIIHNYADYTDVGNAQYLDIGGVRIEPFSCSMNLYPINYTDPDTTVFPTLTPTSSIVLPTAGL